jgi:hypothetical protein
VYGYSPVCIETAAGRAEYVRLQGGLSSRSGVVREALLARCRELLAASTNSLVARAALVMVVGETRTLV